MADKISIDVNINADGKQQLDQYKNAFDGLRNSITSLSNPISKLDSDVTKLNDTLDKTGGKTDVVGDTIDKLTKASKTAEDGFGLLKKAGDFLEKGMISLEGVMSAGLTLVIAFAPEIIKWANSYLKSGEAIDKTKLSIATMNEALRTSDVTNSIKQLYELKINVGLARAGYADKKEVLQQYNSTIGKTMGQVSSLQEVETSYFLI